MKTYVKAIEVTAPRGTLLRKGILVDGGKKWSPVIAWGTWEDKNRLLLRWNGDQEHPLGNPISSAKPTWTVLPTWLVGPTLRTLAARAACGDQTVNWKQVRAAISAFRKNPKTRSDFGL
jgi:hypothetical protein